MYTQTRWLLGASTDAAARARWQQGAGWAAAVRQHQQGRETDGERVPGHRVARFLPVSRLPSPVSRLPSPVSRTTVSLARALSLLELAIRNLSPGFTLQRGGFLTAFSGWSKSGSMPCAGAHFSRGSNALLGHLLWAHSFKRASAILISWGPNAHCKRLPTFRLP